MVATLSSSGPTLTISESGPRSPRAPDPREQRARRERLAEVVIGAELEAQDPVGLVGARRDGQDRHAGRRADLAAHREPVAPRQRQIEDDHVERDIADLRDPALAVAHQRHRDAVLLAELRGKSGEAFIIFDEGQDTAGHVPQCSAPHVGPSARLQNDTNG
jgi:hypothetical protein